MTPEGRLAAGGLMIMGITLYAAITGTITSAFIASREHPEQGAADRLSDLAALLDEGLVDDGEFDRKRGEIMESS